MKGSMGLAIMGEYDLLIFDEPTNHLDLFSREAMEQSLINFPGSILLISHDLYLLDKVCDTMLIFDNCTILRLEGSVSNYLDKKHHDGDYSYLRKSNIEEEKLLLETKITKVLGELSLHKPGDFAYAALDAEYRKLIQLKKQISDY